MPDVIQQSAQTLAFRNALAGDLAVFCAGVVVYLLGLAWLSSVVWRRARLSAATIARVAALVVVAYVASRILTDVIHDPRPYLVEHVRPLMDISRDNGFPSDHTLLAAALAASLWWIDRRLVLPFAVGTVLVMLGRLGVGAHHTLDVLGSVAIVTAAAVLAGALPLPVAWKAPLLRRAENS